MKNKIEKNTGEKRRKIPTNTMRNCKSVKKSNNVVPTKEGVQWVVGCLGGWVVRGPQGWGSTLGENPRGIKACAWP